MDIKNRTLKNLAVIIALIMLGVVLNVFDWILMLLPNIELVTPLLIIYTYKFGAKALISAYVYAFIEIATHGFNVWNIMYLYVWAILVLIIWPLTKIKNKKVATPIVAAVAGLYGLAFGTLCSIPYWFMGGPSFALAWIASGFSFDLIHAASNLVATAILYIPLCKVMDKIKI